MDYKTRYESMLSMFCDISEALDIPDDEAACANGHDLILEAIKTLKSRPTPEQSGEARDAARLDWLAQYGAWVAWGRDGELCRVFHHSDDEDGRAVPFCGWGAGKCYATAREAIDAAMDRSAPGREA